MGRPMEESPSGRLSGRRAEAARDHEAVAPGVFRIEDDYFLEQVVRDPPVQARFGWHGREYLVDVPADAGVPAFLVVEGVSDPPPGELVLVLTRKAGLRDLFRPASTYQAAVRAQEVG